MRLFYRFCSWVGFSVDEKMPLNAGVRIAKLLLSMYLVIPFLIIIKFIRYILKYEFVLEYKYALMMGMVITFLIWNLLDVKIYKNINLQLRNRKFKKSNVVAVLGFLIIMINVLVVMLVGIVIVSDVY